MATTTTTVAIKDANSASQSIATLTDPAGYERAAVSLDTPGVAAYRVSATFTPQATNAVTLITVTGSATKTVRIKRIQISGYATAVGNSVFALQRTTALGAGGTIVTPNVAKLDSGTVAAATAVVTHYTGTLKAAGTATGVGPLHTYFQFIGTVTTPATAVMPPQDVFPGTGSLSGGAIVLRGATDYLEVQNIAPASLGAVTLLQYTVEWEEDAS